MAPGTDDSESPATAAFLPAPRECQCSQLSGCQCAIFSSRSPAQTSDRTAQWGASESRSPLPFESSTTGAPAPRKGAEARPARSSLRAHSIPVPVPFHNSG
jgi:hypothetical protein